MGIRLYAFSVHSTSTDNNIIYDHLIAYYIIINNDKEFISDMKNSMTRIYNFFFTFNFRVSN